MIRISHHARDPPKASLLTLALRYVLNMSHTWQLTVAVAILGLSATAAYTKRKHNSLEAKVNRHTIYSQERSEERKEGNLQSLPETLLTNSNTPALLHEKCSILIPSYAISNESPEHFIHLLRHNMINFSRFPQAWIFWLMLPKHRHTFSRAYIERLDFVEGDLICGVYRVVKASTSRVELSMEVQPRFGAVAGLLIISLQSRADLGVVFSTETLQWTLEGTIKDLPLSKPLPKLLHEFASAYLLISGAEFLESISRS